MPKARDIHKANKAKHQVNLTTMFKRTTNKIKTQSKRNKLTLAIFTLLFAGIGGYFIINSFAATPPIYVSTTGSDSNSGTEASPFKTIQKAANTVGSCGTVIVKPGIYKERSTGSGNTAAVTVPAAASGGSACKTVFKAENRWNLGAKTEINTEYQARYGFDLSLATNIRVEGFEIYGQAPPATSNTDSAGVWAGGNGSEVVGNNIHDVGGCITVANDKGQVAVYLDSDNSVVEQNYIHDIGRSNVTGCTGGDQAHDHGIYVNGSGTQSGNIIRNNLFYSNTKGYAVQIYPGTINNLSLVHNTFVNNASGNGAKSGNSIITGYGTTLNGANISNNIFYNTPASIGANRAAMEMGNSLTVGTSSMQNNIYNGTTISDNATNYAKFTGTSTNQTGKTPAFVNPASDYHLQSTDTVAKDKVLPSSIVINDYDGNCRPNGAAKDANGNCVYQSSTNNTYDIGAFEYGTLVSTSTSTTCPDLAKGECRPYDDQSPFNQPIPAYDKVTGKALNDGTTQIWNQSNSTTYTNQLQGLNKPLTSNIDDCTPGLYEVNDQSGISGSDVYDLQKNPIITSNVYQTDYKFRTYNTPFAPNDGGGVTASGATSNYVSTATGVPVTANVSADNCDGQTVFWNPITGDEWGFWYFDPSSKSGSNPTTYVSANGHKTKTLPGFMGRFGDGGGRGAGTTYFSGLVRKWEIKQGVIEHALSFAFQNPVQSTFVYPAGKTDGAGGTSIPEGTRFQLDPDLTDTEITNLGCVKACLTIAHALQKYGMYAIDNSGSSKIYLEADRSAHWNDSNNDGVTDTLNADIAYVNSMRIDLPKTLPWNKFRVVVPPCVATSTSSCPTTQASSPPPTCTSSKPSDINCDNNVNIADLSILLSNYGKTTSQLSTSTPSYPRADINNSGKVDIADLSVLLSGYGR